MSTDRADRGKRLLGAEVTAETKREFEEMAYQRRTSVSALLREAIEDKLDEHDREGHGRQPEPQEAD